MPRFCRLLYYSIAMFKTRACGEGKNGKPVIEEKGTAKDVSNAAKSFIFSHFLYNPDKHQRPHPPPGIHFSRVKENSSQAHSSQTNWSYVKSFGRWARHMASRTINSCYEGILVTRNARIRTWFFIRRDEYYFLSQNKNQFTLVS